MANEREVGVLIKMKNNSAAELKKVERDIAMFARNAKRHFDLLSAGLKLFWTGRIFGGLLGASKELNDKWREWKESVMDAGPKQAIEGLGIAMAGLVTGTDDSKKAAEDLGLVLMTTFDFAARGVIAVAGAVDLLRLTATGVKGTFADVGSVLSRALMKADILGFNKKLFDGMTGTKDALAQAAWAFDEMSKKSNTYYEDMATALREGTSNSQKLLDKWMEFRNQQDLAISQRAVTLAEILAAMRAQLALEEELLWKKRAKREVEKDYQEELKRANEILEDRKRVISTLQGMAQSLGNDLIQIYDDWINGQLKRADQYLKDIVASIGRMAAQAAIQTAINVAFKAIGSAVMGGGGVAVGGMSLPSYAGGTVVSGPRPAVIGDNPERMEAVVPMRNRKIPVEIKGGGGMGRTEIVNIHVSAMDGDSVRRVLLNNPEALGAAIRKARRENPRAMEN